MPRQAGRAGDRIPSLDAVTLRGEIPDFLVTVLVMNVTRPKLLQSFLSLTPALLALLLPDPLLQLRVHALTSIELRLQSADLTLELAEAAGAVDLFRVGGGAEPGELGNELSVGLRKGEER